MRKQSYRFEHQAHCSLPRVFIKGDDNDDAVLCTDDATYSIKLAETSNTVLLIPPNESDDAMAFSSSAPRHVIGTAPTCFELVLTPPKYGLMLGT